MSDPFQVVKDFENELCRYTGAPYAVTTTSCTMALLLAVAWHLRSDVMAGRGRNDWSSLPCIEIPRRTYIGVPYAIIEAGGRPVFRDDDWHGLYDLRPLNIFDSARFFTSDLWFMPPQGVGRPVTPNSGYMICTSFHWAKTLGVQQGGCILHDNPEADEWLRRARFDGCKEGVAPKDDTFPLQRAWHAYMSPEVAAAGLVRLSHLPKHNDPLPNDDYADLSQLEVFK